MAITPNPAPNPNPNPNHDPNPNPNPDQVAGGRLELYKSVRYPKFMRERAERQQRALATVEAQEREARRLQDLIDRINPNSLTP